MRLDAERLRQRPEDVLPGEEAVGEKIHSSVSLDADEGRQVVGERTLDCVGADSTPVDSAGRRHHLLRTRIDAVLIGKDVDPKSVDEATHLDRGRETD